MIYRIFKRTMDLLISLIGVILLLPLFIIIATLIKITSKGPIIFKQDRIGKNGKIFKIYKFRSMVVGAEKKGVYEAKKDKRVTKIGKFIRKTSIDELPQFFNIIKGDMSIIGPRPTLTYHPWKYEEYTEEQLKRFNVRPGVTGWAQVNGRKDVEWNKRIELDIYYVNNISFKLDLKIFLKTIINVLKMKDNVNVKKTVVEEKHLKLMYITNDPVVAEIADKNGVDIIFIDLEILGKEERQPGDTVKSNHKISDISTIKKELTNAELMVRVNPINENSKQEINEVLSHKPDIIMLPYFKTKKEVKQLVKLVNKRAKIYLLLETVEAVQIVDDILKIKGIDFIHIGLNDLHLGYKMKFMFELLADGTVEMLCNKFKQANIPYGFGGIAKVGEGTLPAEMIIIEHFRLGSSAAILSRSFYKQNEEDSVEFIDKHFKSGINDIRELEKSLSNYTDEQFLNNQMEVKNIINNIVVR